MTDADPPIEDRTDAELLAAIAAGTEQAFVDLYARRQTEVYRFAYAMAKSRSFAQDVTQEVFLNVLENAGRFDAAKGTVRAWLFGCARYVILDRLRLERRWCEELAEEAGEYGSDEHVLLQQRVARLRAAVAQLPVEYREAVVLCELQELSYAETAAVLACPIGTVRSRLHRGRALLAAMLAEEDSTAAEVTAQAAVGEPAALRPREVCS
jgi:RNA polymerase sigma-70 factor (ECF subfamily)